jgi:hypothetical protein
MVPLSAGATSARLLMIVLAGSVVLAGAWLWLGRGDDDHAEVVSDPATSEWKTIEYRGVQVDIPASWEPLDMDNCEFQFEVWAPPETGCDWAGGVAFYGSATFDPAHGPGVQRVTSPNEPEWRGYTFAGDFAVYASTDDRDAVERILQSAH